MIKTAQAIVALIIVALLVGIGWSLAGWRYKARLADMAMEHAVAVAKAQEQVAQVERDYRQRERQLVEKVDVIANEALAAVDAARRDAAAADRVAGRLRDAATRAARLCSGAAGTTSAGPSGETAGAAGDVLTNVLGRLEEAGRRISGYADESRAAGIACERSYDAVRASLTAR